jgi:hypothetical protein
MRTVLGTCTVRVCKMCILCGPLAARSFNDLCKHHNADGNVVCTTTVVYAGPLPAPAPHPLASDGWCRDFFDAVGLGDLVAGDCSAIGTPGDVRPIGSPVGTGLSAAAAAHLGLLPGTAVAAGMIDAHAGGAAALAGAGHGMRLPWDVGNMRGGVGVVVCV